MADTKKVKIAGAGAFLIPAGEDRGRPFAKGDIVELDAAKAKRLVAEGSAVDPDTKIEDVAPAVEFDPSTADVEALAEWIKTEKVKVPDLVTAAGDNAELAGRLIQAETAANGGKPRKTAIEGLDAIVAAAAQADAAEGSAVDPDTK